MKKKHSFKSLHVSGPNDEYGGDPLIVWLYNNYIDSIAMTTDKCTLYVATPATFVIKSQELKM